jgi:hypothetical protein
VPLPWLRLARRFTPLAPLHRLVRGRQWWLAKVALTKKPNPGKPGFFCALPLTDIGKEKVTVGCAERHPLAEEDPGAVFIQTLRSTS